MSLGQEQTWLLQQLIPGSALPHLATKLRLSGPLDVDALRHSLGTVHERHEALRTVVRFRDGALVQRVVDEPELPLTIHDLAATTPSERSRRLAELEEAELHRAFDLEEGPLVRFHLVRGEERDHHLLVVAHRLVADERSCQVIERDLLACYEAFARGRRPALPDLAFQFPDYALWQREFLQEGRAQQQLEHWQRTLGALPDPLALPLAASRPTEPSPAAGVVHFTLPARLWSAVRELAEEEAAAPLVAVQTAFAVFLHRCTQRQDVLLGTSSSGRHHEGAGDLVGPFADLLPLRLRLPANPTWRNALRLVREADAGARAHPDIPMRRLGELARAGHHLNMAPLVQVVITARPPGEPRSAHGLTCSVEPRDRDEQLHDLDLQVEEVAGELRCALGYKRDLLDAEAASVTAQRLVALLEQMAAAPDERFSNLSVLGDDERERVVRGWNQTWTDYPRESTIQALFEEWADRAPDAPALRWEGFELTYGELERRSNQLAHHLRRLGVGLETGVGLLFGYTADWVIAALATLKAGGAYVPLDPSYPSDRMATMCEDSKVRVLLVQEGLEHRLQFPGPRCVLPAEAGAIGACPATRPTGAAGPHNLAYVMFTSGSTGRPKGIGVSHRNVVRTVRETNYLEFEPTDTVAQASNISFDASTLEIWGALLNGCRLVGLRKEDVLLPQRLREQLVANRIDTMFLPCALMKQLVSELPETFASLKYFLSGGEQADYHTLRSILDHGAPRHLINPYGPTETTVNAVAYECNDMTEAERHVPIGRPLGNTECYVLDQYLQPLPPGVVGELYVGGDGVARGYLGRPDLTAEKFVPDPFGGQPGARLYYTGDLARYRSDGVLEFLGRADRQVKIRGFRIEPGEIEACLQESGSVREVSVQVDLDRGGEPVLVAYVVPRDSAFDAPALREYARGRLPTYMLPAVFVPLPSLPLNANGKLDARALREALPAAGVEAAAAEPRTATEGRLDAIWRDVLGLPSFGVDDDFFALGGTSLGAARVTAAAQAVFRCEVPFRLLFEQPTIASLGAAIDRLRAGESGAPTTLARTPQVPAAPAAGAAGAAPAADRPLTDTEKRVLAIWREVLDVERLDLDDSFFAMGGHSLNATRAVSRAKAVFGREVPLRLLFQNPTAAAFAASIDRLDSDPEDEEPALETAPAARPQSVEQLLEAVEELSDEEVERLLGSDS